MKKLMCLVLLLVLTVCYVGALAEDVTGMWYLSRVTINGVTMNAATVNMGDVTLEMNADGTCILYDEVYSWVKGSEIGEYFITDSSGSQQIFVLDDNGFSTVQGDITIIFDREKAEVFTPGEVVNHPALEDFNGTWSVFLIDNDGTQAFADSMEIQCVITIADGMATLDYATGVYGLSFSSGESTAVLNGNTLNFFSGMSFTLYEGAAYVSWTATNGSIYYFENNTMMRCLNDN